MFTVHHMTLYSENLESSSDHFTTKASPQIANSNHKRIFSRSHDNKNSPRPHRKGTSFHNTLSSPVEPTKNPLNKNPGKECEEDFCEMDFQVSLETLKERVMKKSGKKERGRNSLEDYHIAHNVVNSYWLWRHTISNEGVVEWRCGLMRDKIALIGIISCLQRCLIKLQIWDQIVTSYWSDNPVEWRCVGRL